jgi:hypothetical protein
MISDFELAKSFLFVFPQNLPQNDISYIYEFASEIKAERKEVIFLIYHDFPKIPEGITQKSFDVHVCKKDFNFLQKPTSSLIIRHLHIDYDFLISFNDKANKRLEKFVSKSKAKIKIGRYEPVGTSLYKILLTTTSNENGIRDFLSLAGTYLTKIKIES